MTHLADWMLSTINIILLLYFAFSISVLIHTSLFTFIKGLKSFWIEKTPSPYVWKNSQIRIYFSEGFPNLVLQNYVAISSQGHAFDEGSYDVQLGIWLRLG